VINGIEQLDIKDKRVFIRVDYNVPMDGTGRIADDTRIKASLPTLRYVIDQGARILLGSHLGRPKGKVDPKLSLLPVAEHLSELLNQEVFFPEDCVGNAVRKLSAELKEGSVILLENLRFHPGEEANDPQFAEKLASNADAYINDAFGTLHRAHASTVGMVPFVEQKAAGKLVLNEIGYLNKIIDSPDRPFVALLGGAKVSDKLGVIENLLKKVDALLIGGAMAYTFLLAQGISVGSSLVESGKVHQAERILDRVKVRDIPFVLPLDHVIAREIKKGTEFKTTQGPEIPEGWMGVDVGPKTLERFSDQISRARTVLWNGPVGAFEFSPFDRGTVGVARFLAESSATSLVGGGDSLAAVKAAGVENKISHLSTGGGATLEFLEGKNLPGLRALEIEAS